MISCRNCIYFTIKKYHLCYCKKKDKYLLRRLGIDFVGCKYKRKEKTTQSNCTKMAKKHKEMKDEIDWSKKIS